MASILCRVPGVDAEFREYLLGQVGKEGPAVAEDELLELFAQDDPDVRARARRLAEQLILTAKAEALDKLGDERAAEAPAEPAVREWDQQTYRRSLAEQPPHEGAAQKPTHSPPGDAARHSVRQPLLQLTAYLPRGMTGRSDVEVDGASLDETDEVGDGLAP